MFEQSVFYQIYPLGLCGAPAENDGATVPRIRRVIDWIPHIKALGADAVYFCPVFESDRHGYDTRDYTKLDCRLGTNADFAAVCEALRESGIRVYLDGVFNHVGRGFFAFEDVIRNREASRYRDWFEINFNGNSPYNDGFSYAAWEGHYELVKLNLRNEAVVRYLFDAIRGWREEFHISGLRLDVAYCIDPAFLRRLRAFCDGLADDFTLIGEVLFGDYNRLVGGDLLHSCTNYECYKGLYSSFVSMNLFEICHSLARQFGPEQWTLYKNKHLLCFAENHDVTRVASILTDKNQLRALYCVLFAMPGVPCVYYGGEWGAQGRKEQGDAALRPEFEAPAQTAQTTFIAQLARAHKESRALCYGAYRNVLVTNQRAVFERSVDGETVLALVSASGEAAMLSLNVHGAFTDLLTGEDVEIAGQYTFAPYEARLLSAR
ncbi:MAG: alpha-amylase family glycosyl hydrolase [Oscillospiraceae bacterium]